MNNPAANSRQRAKSIAAPGILTRTLVLIAPGITNFSVPATDQAKGGIWINARGPMTRRDGSTGPLASCVPSTEVVIESPRPGALLRFRGRPIRPRQLPDVTTTSPHANRHGASGEWIALSSSPQPLCPQTMRYGLTSFAPTHNVDPQTSARSASDKLRCGARWCEDPLRSAIPLVWGSHDTPAADGVARGTECYTR